MRVPRKPLVDPKIHPSLCYLIDHQCLRVRTLKGGSQFQPLPAAGDRTSPMLKIRTCATYPEISKKLFASRKDEAFHLKRDIETFNRRTSSSYNCLYTGNVAHVRTDGGSPAVISTTCTRAKSSLPTCRDGRSRCSCTRDRAQALRCT